MPEPYQQLTEAEIRACAESFKAMAHPVRLKIVLRLAAGECTVSNLVDLAGIGFPAVSRHLSVLRNAGIVEDEKRGAQVFYRLVAPCIMDFFRCVASLREK